MDVVKALCKAGAGLEVVDSNSATALLLAAGCSNNLGCVQELLRAGASASAVDARGRGGLEYALASADLEARPPPPHPALLDIPFLSVSAALA